MAVGWRDGVTVVDCLSAAFNELMKRRELLAYRGRPGLILYALPTMACLFQQPVLKHYSKLDHLGQNRNSPLDTDVVCACDAMNIRNAYALIQFKFVLSDEKGTCHFI